MQIMGAFSRSDRGVLYALWNLDCGQVAAVLRHGRNSCYATVMDETLAGTMSCRLTSQH